MVGYWLIKLWCLSLQHQGAYLTSKAHCVAAVAAVKFLRKEEMQFFDFLLSLILKVENIKNKLKIIALKSKLNQIIAESQTPEYMANLCNIWLG